jgi:hypothetical protein
MNFINWKAVLIDVAFSVMVIILFGLLAINITGCGFKNWSKQAIKHGWTTGHESK